MKHARQVAIVREIIRHADANTTPMADAPHWNPVDRYTSESHFRTEIAAMFHGRLPLLAGFSPDLPAPGAWFTYDMPDAPLFVSDFGSHIKHAEGFHRRWMGSNEAKNDWCRRARALKPKFLCPQHGAIYRGDDVTRFIDWFEALEVGRVRQRKE